MRGKRPHDADDLLLSPVALALDARLAELGRLTPAELERRVATETSTEPRSHEGAALAICEVAGYLIDTHGWTTSWDRRGLRLQHGEHGLVLGVPENIRRYVMTAAGAANP